MQHSMTFVLQLWHVWPNFMTTHVGQAYMLVSL